MRYLILLGIFFSPYCYADDHLASISHTQEKKVEQGVASDFLNHEEANMKIHVDDKQLMKDDVTNYANFPRVNKKCGLELLISREAIAKRIKEYAHILNDTYQDKPLTIVIVMKGAICLAADLMRHLNIPFEIQYLTASSYGQRGTTAGELQVTGFEQIDLASKNVLVVDDIFDTGNTMTKLIDLIKEKKPNSLHSLVLLTKNVPHVTSYRPDYTLFEIENRFVVGYGLDYKEYYRGLPGIYSFLNDTPPDSFHCPEE